MDSNFQSKLQGFSAEPPEGVWGRIADALGAEGSFAQRLHQHEESPPAVVWTEIERSLDVPMPAKETPFITRFRKPLRYAAAASIIAVALVAVTLSIKRTEAGAIDPGSNATVPTKNAASAAKVSQGEKKPPQTAISSQQDNTNQSKYPDNPVVSTESMTNKTTQAVYSSLNEYVSFNDGDGKRRKVSKKLINLVRCKDGDVACQQRLQQLRQKLAANAMTTDFTGILEMMRQLQ